MLNVVAAVIHNPHGQILIAQRPLHKHQGGLWEFSGGKIDDGETASQALVRELQEELGITATQYRPLLTCLLYTSPSPRDRTRSRMPSSA